MSVTDCAASKASPLLTKMPKDAPTLVPTIIAVGVANPSAHGQAITKTAIAKVNDITKLLSPYGYQSRGIIPADVTEIHTIKVRREMNDTTGTKTPATLSAKICIFGLFTWAS